MGKTLTIALALTVVAIVAMLGYVMAVPKPREQFTEFYLLGPGGIASDYPKELIAGKESKVTVGIINHEYKTTTYRLEVRINGNRNGESQLIELNQDAKWEKPIILKPEKASNDQKIEFLLYKNSEDQPYRELHLWVNIREAN